MRKLLFVAAVAFIVTVTCACSQPSEPQPTAAPTMDAPLATPSPLEYQFNTERENPGGDYYSEPSEELKQKVNEILLQCAHPQNDFFENVLGLYQYISQNIIFKETGAADSAEVILSGTANANGFGRAYQYLLNQIGVEAVLAISNDDSKTWVMVSMPDGWYHFDAAEEAQQTSGQSLGYFAMNDEQRWGGGKIDGWYIAAAQENEKKEAPKNEKQTYTYLRNVRAGYGVDFENDCMYFADVRQDNELVRYYYQTGAEESLYGKRSGSMVYHKGSIYYSDLTQRNQLFKMDVSTGDTELLDSVFVTRMLLKNGNLIYFDDVSSSEKAISLS